MIKIKHFLDTLEDDDGNRIWVEPFGLTADLREWCKVDNVVSHIGPPRELWEWFEEHPDGYDYFRGKYHEYLAAGPYKESLKALAVAARRENITLLHQGDDPGRNSAVALYEFINELGAYCPPEL